MPSSKEQLEGTEAHRIAAMALRGEPLPTDDDSREMVKHAIDYLGVVAAFEQLNQAPNREVEQRIAHPANPQVRGDADVISYGKESFVVGDYKYGQGSPVNAESNEQLLATAVTKLRSFGDAAGQYSGVTLFIYQPRSLFGAAFSSVFVTIEQLLVFENFLLDAAVQAEAVNAPYVPGTWCKICPGRSICPVFQEEVIQPLATAPPLRELSLHEMGRLMDLATLATRYADDLKTYVKQSMKMGHPVPGWNLKTRRGPRQWEDPDLANFELELLIGDGRFAKTLLSPTQVLLKSPHLEEKIGSLIKETQQYILTRSEEGKANV